jgi:hypothetical protein
MARYVVIEYAFAIVIFSRVMNDSSRNYRGRKIPSGPTIIDAITSTATIVLPMSNILFLFTATSFNPNRNLLQQKNQPS